jgi:hypothetical protein
VTGVLRGSFSGCPHDSQKRLATGFGRPHPAQGDVSGEPQPPQNSAPGLGVRPHTEQDTGSSVLAIPRG